METCIKDLRVVLKPICWVTCGLCCDGCGASCCCSLYAHKVSGKIGSFMFPKDEEAIFPETSCAYHKDNNNSPHGKFHRFYFHFPANF